MTFRVEFAHPSTFTHRARFISHLNFGAGSAPALPKCEHGIYLARGEERASHRAHYCGACNPNQHHGALGGESRKMFFAQRYQSSPRTGRLTANRNERRGNGCPKCGSCYRYKIEGSVMVECSECSERWKPILRGDLKPEGTAG